MYVLKKQCCLFSMLMLFCSSYGIIARQKVQYAISLLLYTQTNTKKGHEEPKQE